ncbi:MAG: TolC family protein [Nitrospinae bacterium]|nr:TolC family protein [Nitrospinota bacterium]
MSSIKNILNISFESPEGESTLVQADQPQIIREEIDLNEAIKTALSQRPDYMGKKKGLENQNIKVRYRENQIYPSVDLVGSLGLNGLSGEAVNVTSGTVTGKSKFGGDYGQALSDTFSTKFFNWGVGMQLSYPLGNRSARSQLTASRLEVAQLLLDIKNLEKEIIVEVREAVRQIKTDSKRVDATRVARRLAEEKLKAEEKKFEVGLSTSFNVLEFQEDLAEEQSKEIKAVIDYNKSKIRLRQVTAATLDSHGIKLKAKENS